jgi:catalase
MATRKTPRKTPAARSSSAAASPSPLEGLGSAMSTMSGPSPSMPALDAERLHELPEAAQRAAGRYAGTQALAAAMPHNALKDGEHGLKGGHAPQAGTPCSRKTRPTPPAR